MSDANENVETLTEKAAFAAKNLETLQKMQEFLSQLPNPFGTTQADYIKGALQNVVHTTNKMMDLLRDAAGDEIKKSDEPTTP